MEDLIPELDEDEGQGTLVRDAEQPRPKGRRQVSEATLQRIQEFVNTPSRRQSAPQVEQKPKPLGFMGTIKEGAKGTLRALGAAADTYQGDAEEVISAAQAQTAAPKDPDLERFYAHIEEQKQSLGDNPSLWEGIKAVGGAAIDNPRGFGLMVAEQLPNSGVALGAGAAGALAGSFAGPAGAVVGGLAGLAGANIGLETGHKALEAAADGDFPSEERARVLDEGAVKGGVVSIVDAGTLGVTKFITNASRRAVERATIKTLTDNGVDVTSAAARRAAMETPEIAEAVKASQELAKQGATTLGKRLAQTGGAVALETIGEGAGEYLGELAATGKANAVDAVIEGFAGLGTSIGEIAAVGAMNRKGLKRLFDNPEEAENTAKAETEKTGVEHEAIKHPTEPDKFAAVPKVRSVSGIELERDAEGNLKPVAPVSTQADFNIANREGFELTAEDKIREREIEKARSPIIVPTIAGKPVGDMSNSALIYTVERGSARAQKLATDELAKREQEGVDSAIANAPEKPADIVSRIITTGKEKAQEGRKKAAAAIITPKTVKPATAPKVEPVVIPEAKKAAAPTPAPKTDTAINNPIGKATEPEKPAKVADKKIVNRGEAEKEVITQLEKQWTGQAGGKFIIGKKYPATISLSGKERKVGLFKNKGSGTLYAEALDETIYGPVFTIYKVSNGKLVQHGERNLFAHTKEGRAEQIAAFNSIFEQAKPTVEPAPERPKQSADNASPPKSSEKDQQVKKAEPPKTPKPAAKAEPAKPEPTSEAPPLRNHIADLIKRRAAASQSGKSRSVNSAIGRAKEVMDGKRTDTALESKWFRAHAAAMRKADPDTADILSRISEAIKAQVAPTKAKADNAANEKTKKAKPSMAVRGDQKPVPRGGRILANGIAETIQRNGVAALVGQKITSPERLAELAQVYRNPQYETFRIFFTKRNKIVHASGVTSRLPGSTPIFPKDMDFNQGLKWIKGMMESSGADGYWMLHNHPSGNPTPSNGDMKATASLASQLPGFKGHVVINSNKYAQITVSRSNLKADVVTKDFGEDKLLQASKPHEYLGRMIPGTSAVVEIGKSFQKEGWVTLIGVSGVSGVRSIAEIPLKTFTTPMLARAAIRRFARKAGTESVFAYGKEADLRAGNAAALTREGFLRSAVNEEGRSHGIGDPIKRSFGRDSGTGGTVVQQDSQSESVDELKNKLIEAKTKFKAGKGSPVKELFRLSNEISDARDNLAAAYDKLPDDSFALQGETFQGKMLFLAKSAQKPGMWQLTRFDAKGEPWGDTQYPTKKQGIEDFLREAEAATVKNVGALELQEDETQSPQTNSPAFKKWFGNSKVVDRAGKPLRVYHGTIKSFDAFDSKADTFHFDHDTGFHYFYKSPRSASEYAEAMGDAYGGDANVMPVYLSMKKPLKITVEGEPSEEWDTSGAKHRKQLREGKYDGAIVRSKISSEVVYVVVSPTQIKSAIGNSGTFDKSGLILNEDQASFNSKAPFRTRIDKITDTLIFNFQDRFKPLKDIQKRAGPVPETEDASLAEERYSGMVRARMDTFEEQMRDPLLKAIHDSGVPFEEVEKYLHALHAPSRNAAMREINPTETELKSQTEALEKQRDSLANDKDVKEFLKERRDLRQAEADIEDGIADESLAVAIKRDIAQLRKNQNVKDYTEALDKLKALRSIKPFQGDNTALSGMSNAEAKAILAKIDANGTRKALDKVSALVDTITSRTRQIFVESGLEKADTIDAWNKKYEHYIPLHRDEVSGNTMPKIGQGFNIRGKESKRATGSTKEVTNILAHVVAQHEAAIIRAEKSKVDRALFQFAKTHPDPSLWTLDVAPMLKTVDPTSGLVVERVDPTYKNRDEVLTLKIDGEEHTITFNDQNLEAMRLASSMKNLNSQQLGEVTQIVGKFTRFLATMNTTANPVFVARNFLRDLQTAFVNLSDTEIAAKKKEVFQNIPAAIKGMWNLSRGKGGSQWAKYAQEFKNAGGQTGWMEHYKDIGARADSIKAELAAMGPGKANASRRALKTWWQTVEDANNAVENGARLAAFVAARRSGISEGKAASMAKNLTVNFNARGAKGVELNMWYMFMNASIQGTARLIKAMSNKQVRKIVAGVILSGFLMDIMARSMAGDDDDDGENDYDQLPEHTKAMNFVFMLDGQPVTLPMPYGYNFFASAGRKISEMMFRENYSAVKSAVNLTGIFLDAFSPVGQAGSGLQYIAPTVADPLIQWAENKNFAGNPLRKAQNSFGPPKPEFLMGFKSTSAPAKWLAETLNNETGGNEVRPGYVDVNPAMFDFVVSSILGGMGRTYMQSVSGPIKVAGGDDLQAREIPFLNIFVGARPEHQTERKYFEAVESVERAANELSTFRQKGDTDMVRQIREDHRGELRLAEAAKATKRILANLRKSDHALDKTDPPNKKELRKKIEERKREVMARFNKQYRAATTAE